MIYQFRNLCKLWNCRQFCDEVKEHISTSTIYISQKMNINVKLPGDWKYTKRLVEICPGLLGITVSLKKRLGISSHRFSSERPHVQLHRAPVHPVESLVRFCHGKKNVAYKGLWTTSAAFLVFLENVLFKYQVAPASPWEPTIKCCLRFRCLLFLPFY